MNRVKPSTTRCDMDGKKLEYEIIWGERPEALTERVRDRIKEGWTPLGAPFIDPDEDYVNENAMFQAMTRQS